MPRPRCTAVAVCFAIAAALPAWAQIAADAPAAAAPQPVSKPAPFATGAYETSDFAVVTDAVKSAVAKHGAGKVLLVCDIDNTLLAMRGDLGSDQWFEWQEYLLENEPGSPDLVADSFPELLAAQGILFSLGTMRPPQDDLPEQIEKAQAMGVRTLVLTSRGDEYRQATERELRANGYDFASTVLPTKGFPCGVFTPYDLDAIEQSGITKEEARRFQLGKPRGVSFSGGVFMAAGQHKGAMLLSVLARCDEEFAAVIFVDDHGRHIVRVYDALAGRGVEVASIHYQREDANVDRFNYGDKQDVARKWRRLEKTLDAVFN
ncbi:MAG: DUF2608 domain-containing protein [Planctomycetota bacterium]